MSESADNWVLHAVSRYERPLLRFATSLVGAAQAPDVVQDTFLELCKQDNARVEGHLAAWLFTVAKNRALDWLRRSGRSEALPEGENMESPDSGPQNKVERRQTLTRVERLVGELPEREREAVLLRFSGGLSYQEIAQTMELSVSNVGFILHSAMKTIRAELGDVARERRAQ
jgi:RNA polymerase sigma-70 factor (ECF subfamily)